MGLGEVTADVATEREATGRGKQDAGPWATDMVPLEAEGDEEEILP